MSVMKLNWMRCVKSGVPVNEEAETDFRLFFMSKDIGQTGVELIQYG